MQPPEGHQPRPNTPAGPQTTPQKEQPPVCRHCGNPIEWWSAGALLPDVSAWMHRSWGYLCPIDNNKDLVAEP